MSRRFFCEKIPEPGFSVTLCKKESYHLSTVLRSKPEERIILMDGRGTEAISKIETCAVEKNSSQVSCKILEKSLQGTPRFRFVLYISPPKSEGLRQIIRHSVELGVWEIIPILTERCISKPTEKAMEKWQVDALEACKQSGNVFLPQIHPPKKFSATILGPNHPGFIGVVPISLGNNKMVSQSTDLNLIIQQFERIKCGHVGLWIGPEGGFTPEETNLILSHDILPICLSPWTLRVETAVISSLALLNRLSLP